MRFSQLDIKGLWLIEPKRFGDDRGYFAETFRRAEFEEATGANGDFIQDNESVSRYGVVRGLHFQRGEFWQAKIVRVSRGAVLDVAVDLRDGRQRPAALHSPRVCPRVRRAQSRSAVPV